MEAQKKCEEDKLGVLKRLEMCRDEKNSLDIDITVLSRENKLSCRRFKKLADENTRLNSQIITLNANNVQLQSENNRLSIENSDLVVTNAQNIKNIFELNLTINNVRQELVNQTVKANNCGAVSGEWQHRFEIEFAKNSQLEAANNEKQATIDELTATVAKLTSDLSDSLNKNHDSVVENDKLNDAIDALNRNISDINLSLQLCNSQVSTLNGNLNAEELDDIKLGIRIEELEVAKANLESNNAYYLDQWNIQKNKTAECHLDNQILQAQSSTDAAKCQETIQCTINTYTEKLNACQLTVQNERDINIEVNANINILKNNVANLTTLLNIATQVLLTAFRLKNSVLSTVLLLSIFFLGNKRLGAERSHMSKHGNYSVANNRFDYSCSGKYPSTADTIIESNCYSSN